MAIQNWSDDILVVELSDDPQFTDDVDSLLTGVEWIYQLRVAGTSAQSPAEDVKLARTYADAYAKAKGPQAALVRRWMDFLEKK